MLLYILPNLYNAHRVGDYALTVEVYQLLKKKKKKKSVPLWWKTLIMGKQLDAGVYRKFLYLQLNFPVKLKLLPKIQVN